MKREGKEILNDVYQLLARLGRYHGSTRGLEGLGSDDKKQTDRPQIKPGDRQVKDQTCLVNPMQPV